VALSTWSTKGNGTSKLDKECQDILERLWEILSNINDSNSVIFAANNLLLGNTQVRSTDTLDCGIGV
jgi:hypothetical protein